MQESKTLHYILGVSLVMIAVFVVASLVMINSQADNSQAPSNVNIANSVPTVTNLVSSTANNGASGVGTAGDSTQASTGISLTSGAATPFFLNGVITDTNGQADILQVDARFYRNNVSVNGSTGFVASTNCTSSETNDGATKNHCFYKASCALDTNSPAGGSGGNTKRFSCTFSLPFYTQGTGTGTEAVYTGTTNFDDYAADVIVTDATGTTTYTRKAFDVNNSATATESTASRRVLPNLSLNIPSANIFYGNLANGASNADGAAIPMVISQAGNDVADVAVYYSNSGPNENLDCTFGADIPGSNQKHNTFSTANLGYADSNGVALSTSTSATANLAGGNLAYQATSAGVVQDTIYWSILVPFGSTGVCNGTIHVVTTPE